MSDKAGHHRRVPRRWRPTVVGPTRGDLLAGVTVAATLIPQSVAFAELAGLPPEHGLYSAAVAPLAAALIGSSPYLQSGPGTVTSLLTLGALGPFVTSGSSLATHAALLAILVGAVRLSLGLMRLGSIAYLLSQPVMVGFTAAAATLILTSQVPAFAGVSAESANSLVQAGETLGRPGDWNVAALVIGISTIAVIMFGRRLNALLPWPLLATGAALAASSLHLMDTPTLGTIPSGLPPLNLDLPWESIPNLLLPATVIAVVGFAEPAAIARRYATADRQRWNPAREMIGQGLANVASGMTSGYPAGGSFSRSALARLAGARTRWSGAVSGLIVMAIMPAAGVLSALPRAATAALVIVAALSLFDIAAVRQCWRYSRPQVLVLAITCIATLTTAPRVEFGLVTGIGLGIAVHLWREMRVDVDVHRDGATLYLRPQGVLYFASAHALEGSASVILAAHPTATRIILDLSRLGRLDLTGLLTLRALVREAHDSGRTVALDGLPRRDADRIRSVLGFDSSGRQTIRSDVKRPITNEPTSPDS